MGEKVIFQVMLHSNIVNVHCNLGPFTGSGDIFISYHMVCTRKSVQQEGITEKWRHHHAEKTFKGRKGQKIYNNLVGWEDGFILNCKCVCRVTLHYQRGVGTGVTLGMTAE